MKLKELPPDVRESFRQDDQKVRIRNSIVGCYLAIILMPAGISLDYFVYPDQMWFFLKLRLLCSLAVAGVLLLFYTSFGKRHYLALGQIWYLLPAFFISWMIYASEGEASSYYAGLIIVMIAVGFMLPWTYQEILVGGLTVMGMYLAACVFHGNLALKGSFFNNLYFLVLTEIIVVTGSYFAEQTRISEYFLRFKLDKNSRSLEEAYQKLLELDQMKTRFFSNISHELRTPLTLLIGPLDELHKENGQFDEKTRGILRVMETNAMRLMKLINDLLDLVKMEKGEMKVRKEALRVEPFFKGIVNSLQHATKDKGLKLTTEVQTDLPAIMMDSQKVENIALNLLFNSIKFTPEGGRIGLACRKEGSNLLIQVKDTGIGISEEQLPHIFDRFFQVDASATRKHQGSGLGLSIVSEYVQLLGGHIQSESRVGEGTTISVYLPFEKAEGIPDGKEGVEKDGFGEGPAPEDLRGSITRRAQYYPALNPIWSSVVRDENPLEFKGKKTTVLVVDDEPDMREFFKTILKGKHLEVQEAADGLQGVEKARQFIPDLILLDMMMPEKDGVQVCTELRENLLTRMIPVIMLTARADDETKLAALDAGANDFLTKPFSSTELHVRVRNLLESSRFQRELAQRKKELEALNDKLKEALDELLKTQGELVQSKKMAGLGTMAAGIMHEILNPLNYAKNGFQSLMGEEELSAHLEKFKDVTNDIEDGLNRIQKLVNDMRTFTHPHSSDRDIVKLAEVVEMARRFLSHEIQDRVEVRSEVPPDFELFMDKIRMSQVFLNLMKNSLEAFENKEIGSEPPAIIIRAQVKEEAAWITVWDNGPGIEPELMEKLFEPFFTTKEVGKGTGLGLYNVHQIVEEQGGRISAKSEKGKYTEFTIKMPIKIPQ